MTPATALPCLQVFLASQPDNLTCQSFYNRSSGKMLRDLLAAWHTNSSSSAFARRRSSIGAGDGDAPQVAMVNIPVDAGSCATFGELFSQLLTRRSMLCLALYRQVGQGVGWACEAGQWCSSL